MKRKLVNSQMSNYLTYQMYLRQCLTLAENVFEFEDIPNNEIDISFVNSNLLRKGSIAWFEDEVMGLLALPYVNLGTLDVYGRPTKIQVHGSNGYTRILKRGEFVIMYDNNGRYPLYLDICQYAERLAQDTRTADINIAQQKTPRVWKTSQDHEKSVKDLVNNVDGYENVVITYEDINLDDTTLILAPAPFVADKIDIHKDKNWSEFLRLIGISNLSYQKKERNISNEIQAMQGGTIASRYSRYEPRKRAIDEINEKFGCDIKIKYYDGLPSNQKEKEDFEDDISMDDNAEDSVE